MRISVLPVVVLAAVASGSLAACSPSQANPVEQQAASAFYQLRRPDNTPEQAEKAKRDLYAAVGRGAKLQQFDSTEVTGYVQAAYYRRAQSRYDSLQANKGRFGQDRLSLLAADMNQDLSAAGKTATYFGTPQKLQRIMAKDLYQQARMTDSSALPRTERHSAAAIKRLRVQNTALRRQVRTMRRRTTVASRVRAKPAAPR